MRAMTHAVLPLTLVALVVYASARPMAADAVIRGVVTDAAGKPLPGVLVKASAGGTSTSRYTGSDGRYEITVPPGTYDLAADGYGFAPRREKKDTFQQGAVDFKLSPSSNVIRLRNADVDNVIPDEGAATLLVKSTCINCHGFQRILRRRGHTAEQWRAYLDGPQMTTRMGSGGMSYDEAKWKVITTELERLFGPEAPYFGPDAEPPTAKQINHPPLAPEVAKATFREYRLPDWPRTMPHSLTVDRNGEVWVAGNDRATNAIIRFDPATEKFQTYPLPTPASVPHTPCVGKDGTVWMTLNAGGIDAKLANVNPKTGELVEYKWPGRQPGTHNCAEDPDGNIWVASLGATDDGLSVYDVKKKEFRGYKYPLPAAYPPGSKALLDTPPGQPAPPVRAGMYDVKIDSQGKIWGAAYTMGMVVSLNPKTGEVKEYFAPDTPQIRGLLVDSQDNVWFGGYDSHKLIKLDQKTGKFTFYQPPTPKAMPYGFVENPRTGHIWYTDGSANAVTRFDPKTQTFVEYPLPSPDANVRLGVGMDPQGRVWWADWFNGTIGMVDPGDGSQTSSARR